MAKIGFTKLGLKKNTKVNTITWNEQIIEVKEYLPIEDKSKVIENIVAYSIDENNFANPMRVKINLVLECVFAYTNINFTEKQKEDRSALYDLLYSSGLWAAVADMLEDEIKMIEKTTREIIDEFYKYKNSVMGILDTISQDYSNLDLDAEKIREKIGNKEGVEFLSEVMEKMG